MDITAALKKVTDEEFAEIIKVSNPLEKTFFTCIRESGMQVYTDEMCPPGAFFFDPTAGAKG